MKYTFVFIYLFTFLIFSTTLSCKKESPNKQLPAITQSGANTFGCFVNGKAYIPYGYNGTGTPNPRTQFDIGLNGLPYFGIVAMQLNKNHESEGLVQVSFRNLIGIGNYNVPNDFNFSVGWNKIIGRNCGMITFDSTIQKWGGGTITKYDLTNGIISGTFNFKYKTLTCDTVYVTDGRFDYKL